MSIKTNTSLPSRVALSMYERLEKCAHRIWNISNDGGELVVERRGDSVDFSSRDIISTGDRVTVFVGGKEVSGRMASMRMGEVGIGTKEGIEYYPMSWVLKAQTAPAPAQPQQPAQPGQPAQAQPQRPKRTTTRNDLTPMAPEQLSGDQRAVADYIKNIVSQRGQVVFQMDPTGADDSDPILTVTPQGNGFKAVQTAKVQRTIFQNTYPTIESMVGALQLNHMPQESPLTKPVQKKK